MTLLHRFNVGPTLACRRQHFQRLPATWANVSLLYIWVKIDENSPSFAISPHKNIHNFFISSKRGSRIFCRGRGSRPDGQKTAWTTFFFIIFSILSVFYTLQRGSNYFIAEKTILFQGSRGGPTFSGRGPTFSRGWGSGPLSPSGSAHALSKNIHFSEKQKCIEIQNLNPKDEPT